jgi:hypothetical protein
MTREAWGRGEARHIGFLRGNALVEKIIAAEVGQADAEHRGRALSGHRPR